MLLRFHIHIHIDIYSYICLHVSMYIAICAYTFLHIPQCLYIYIYICTYSNILLHMHTYSYIFTCILIYFYIFLHIHTSIWCHDSWHTRADLYLVSGPQNSDNSVHSLADSPTKKASMVEQLQKWTPCQAAEARSEITINILPNYDPPFQGAWAGAWTGLERAFQVRSHLAQVYTGSSCLEKLIDCSHLPEIMFKFLILALLVASVLVTEASAWKQCACEHNAHSTHLDCTKTSSCDCTGMVRYGHADTWSESKAVNGSIDCSNTIFNDPAEHQAKECECVKSCDATIPPANGVIGDCTDTLYSGLTCQPVCNPGHTLVGRSSCSDGTLTAATCRVTWQRCACEHDAHSTHADCNETNICLCTGLVRYGHADTWSESKEVDESIDCSNAIFNDPHPHQAKECQCQSRWEQCACEHDKHSTHTSCNTSSSCKCTGEVRYGHADTWSDSKVVQDSIDCSNTIFNDPLLHQAKECQCKQAAATLYSTNQACAAFTTDETCTAASGCEWSKAGDQWKCQDSMYYTQADSSHRNVIASLLLIGFTAQCFV